MKKKLKIYKVISWIVDILLLVCLYFPITKYVDFLGGHIEDWFKGEVIPFMLSSVLGGMLIYYVVKLLAIIWHELGHLVFGLKANLEFVAFNVLSFNFTYEDKKLKVTKEAKLPGNVKGYCNMTTREGVKHSNESKRMFFMGGIIFNIIASIFSLILLLLIKNELIDCILLFNLVMNTYFAIHNALPLVLKTGNGTDALQYLYCLEDDNYLEILSKVQRVNKLLANGIELKDIDEKLFVKPSKYVSKTDILSALFYVDYMVSKEKYKECVELIEDMLEKGKEITTAQDESLMKLQLLICLFELGRIEDIKKYWNEQDSKFLDVMSNLTPNFMILKYMYVLLVLKDNKEADKILEKYNKMDKSKINENDLKDIEELIDKINKSVS